MRSCVTTRSAGAPHCRSLATFLLAAVLCCCSAPMSARADLLLPPSRDVFTGLTGGSYSVFKDEVGKHAAVDGVFVTWGRPFKSAFDQALANHARVMLHISTSRGSHGPEQISPRGIAQGGGDGYLLRLGAAIA